MQMATVFHQSGCVWKAADKNDLHTTIFTTMMIVRISIYMHIRRRIGKDDDDVVAVVSLYLIFLTNSAHLESVDGLLLCPFFERQYFSSLKTHKSFSKLSFKCKEEN